MDQKERDDTGGEGLNNGHPPLQEKQGKARPGDSRKLQQHPETTQRRKVLPNRLPQKIKDRKKRHRRAKKGGQQSATIEKKRGSTGRQKKGRKNEILNTKKEQTAKKGEKNAVEKTGGQKRQRATTRVQPGEKNLRWPKEIQNHPGG